MNFVLDVFLLLIPLFFIFLKKPSISFKELLHLQGLRKISFKKEWRKIKNKRYNWEK